MDTLRIRNEIFITHFRWLTIAGTPILILFESPRFLSQVLVVTLGLALFNFFLQFFLLKKNNPGRLSHLLSLVDILFLTYIYVITIINGERLAELYLFLVIILGIRYGVRNYRWAVLFSSFLYMSTTIAAGIQLDAMPDLFFLFIHLLFIVSFGIMSSYIFKINDQQQRANEKLISELKDAYEKLYSYNLQVQDLANRDPLTSLFNYRYFSERLEVEITMAKSLNRPLSLIILDIDFFKEFNDKFGHPEGDQALKEISALFKQNLRDQDILCRYGGEEFLILLPGSGEEEAFGCAERIRKSVENHEIRLDDVDAPVTITISGGIATYPVNANNGEQLLKIADGLLYSAKQKGRNKIYRPQNRV